MKKSNFLPLTLKLAVATILGLTLKGSTSPFSTEIYERGSGRDELKEQIATDSDETPPPRRRREKTEIAIDKVPPSNKQWKENN